MKIGYSQCVGGSIIFDEDFELEADAATSGSDVSGIPWTLACPGCVAGDFFEVDNNSGNAMGCNGTQGLRGNDTNGPATFTVSNVDLTGCAVISFSFDYCSSGYTGSGNLECVEECSGCTGVPADVVSNGSCNNCWDFLYGELDFGGGTTSTQVLLGDDCTVPPSGSSSSSICGTMLPNGTAIDATMLESVNINIVMAMWATAENMVIDNVVLICYSAAEVAACTDPTVADACPAMCPDFTSITEADLSISVVDNTCAGGIGSIEAPSPNPCPAESVLVYSIDTGTSWSATIPTYDATIQQTIMAACQCDLDMTMFSAMSSEMTNPVVCCDPSISAATPAATIDSESICDAIGGTPAGGLITLPTCPVGSTIEYDIDGSGYSATPVPVYDQMNNIMIQIRCVCDIDASMIGEGPLVMTNAGECPSCNPASPVVISSGNN